MILTVVAFILVLGITITIHEFGHFAMAKLLKIRVLTFSIGLKATPWVCSPSRKVVSISWMCLECVDMIFAYFNATFKLPNYAG